MPVYTVTRQRGTTDRKFQVYVGLLEEVGIDVTNSPRTPEPGTTNRWLYVWNDRVYADRFARELRTRTRDSNWVVHQFDLPIADHGPLVPLTIQSIPTSDGTAFRLDENSRARIMKHFPDARLAGEVFFSSQTRHDYEQRQGAVWDQVAILLTGIPQDYVSKLGGFRVVGLDGEILYEAVPALQD